LKVQSEAAVRNLATRYPYDSHEETQISLRGSTAAVAKDLKTELHERLAKAGVEVVEARLSHLAYAAEIAAAMLQRQQAGAIIAARTRIVEGAVGMVEMALERLSSQKIVNLDEERKAAMVSNLLVVLCGERAAQPILNIDESPTKEGPTKAWVWTFVAATFTFFACRTSRAATVLQELLGEGFGGVIHCDRARMYWSFGRLQWCWAHLKRDFQALIESPCGTTKRLGHDLMKPTRELFALWQKVRDGTISRTTFRRQMQPIRAQVNALLLRGYFNARTYGFCKELVEHKDNLWTFVDIEGIQPTNNAAEQALRHAVIWRKLSFGTQSASGSRFVERLLTVIETCRRQSRNTFQWLTDAVQARLNRQPAPSLLSAG
jgi:transposase